MKSIQKSALAMLLIFIMLFSLMPELYAFDDLTANIKSEGSEVLIEGATTPSTFVSLVVTRDKDGDRMYASQTKSDAKGDYKFAFQLDKGKYDAVLSSNGIQRLRSFQIKSGAAATATVRAEGIEKTLLPLTEIAIEDGESSLIKTIEKALIKGNVPYSMVGELVQTIDGEDGWQYMLNGKGGQITPSTKLNAGDEIVLVRGHLVNPIITKLEVSKNKLELGESFAARLVKIEDGSSPLEDMLVRFEEQEKSTDENGIVTFDTELRGAYKVEAPMEGRLIRPAPVLVEATKEKPRPSYGKMSIKMRIEGYKGTIFDGTIDFDTEDYKGSEGKYIFTDIDGKKYTNSNPTVLLATILALNKGNIGNNKVAYNDNYMARISGEEEFDFAKEHSTCGWMIRSNNQLIYEGVGTWPIRDGDSILWTYTAMDAHTGYIEVSSQSLKTGEKLIVSVTGRSNRDKDIGGYGHKAAVEGATVYVGDRTYTTDKNGKAEIVMDKAGSFEVYALKQDKGSVYKGYKFPLVSKTEKVKVVVTSDSSGNDSDNDSNKERNEGSVPSKTPGDNSPMTVPDIRFDNSSKTVSVKADERALGSIMGKAPVNEKGKKMALIRVEETKGAKAYSLQVPVKSLAELSAKAELKFETPIGTITIPDQILTDFKEASGKDVTITIGQADKSVLPKEVREKLGDRPAIHLNMTVDGKFVQWNNPKVPITVSIPYKPTAEELKDLEHIAVWYIDGAGNAIAVPNGIYDGRAGAVTFSTTHFSCYSVAYVKKTFDDLKNAEWARKPIEVLASKGIINGTGKNSFSPQSNITRADYLILMIKTLGLTAEIDSSFSDIKSEDYFYEAASIAKALGIATGGLDNKFNPKDNISRQDMIVLTERALNKVKKLDKGNKEVLNSFRDKTEIADYALDSMATIIAQGLITGSENKLNPKGDTTRAEAAAFLYRIYNQY